MIIPKEIDNIRKRIEATESYLNIGSWREVTTTLAADDQKIADAANRIDTALERYKEIIEDLSNKVVIPGEVLEAIERVDVLDIPFGLSVNEVVDCAYREDVATLLKGDTDWSKVNPDRKKMIGVISKIASVDLSRTENPWPIVMNSNDKYYTDANIQRCIALYWQRIPLFRLCEILLKSDIDKRTAIAIAYYAKTVSLYQQTEDFKHNISPFIQSDIHPTECTDQLGLNQTGNDQVNIDIHHSEIKVVKEIETTKGTDEIDSIHESQEDSKSPCDHSYSGVNEPRTNINPDNKIAIEQLIDRTIRLYCPYKNGYTAESFAKRLAEKPNSREIVKLINQAVDFRKCEKGVKKDIFKMLVDFGLYRLSYSNFCKHTE